jgi:hypothetical protein
LTIDGQLDRAIDLSTEGRTFDGRLAAARDLFPPINPMQKAPRSVVIQWLKPLSYIDPLRKLR